MDCAGCKRTLAEGEYIMCQVCDDKKWNGTLRVLLSCYQIGNRAAIEVGDNETASMCSGRIQAIAMELMN